MYIEAVIEAAKKIDYLRRPLCCNITFVSCWKDQILLESLSSNFCNFFVSTDNDCPTFFSYSSLQSSAPHSVKVSYFPPVFFTEKHTDKLEML